jgi:hypothetical protein
MHVSLLQPCTQAVPYRCPVLLLLLLLLLLLACLHDTHPAQVCLPAPC